MLNYSCSPKTRERDTFPLSSSELDLRSVSVCKKRSPGTPCITVPLALQRMISREGGLHRAAQGVIEQAASLLC